MILDFTLAIVQEVERRKDKSKAKKRRKEEKTKKLREDQRDRESAATRGIGRGGTILTSPSVGLGELSIKRPTLLGK